MLLFFRFRPAVLIFKILFCPTSDKMLRFSILKMVSIEMQLNVVGILGGKN